MTKILLALALALFVTEASAWVCGFAGGTCPASRFDDSTFHNKSGKVVGRVATDGQGSTTVYDSSGKVIGRESKSGDTTTIYDAGERDVGRVTTSR